MRTAAKEKRRQGKSETLWDRNITQKEERSKISECLGGSCKQVGATYWSCCKANSNSSLLVCLVGWFLEVSWCHTTHFICTFLINSFAQKHVQTCVCVWHVICIFSAFAVQTWIIAPSPGGWDRSACPSTPRHWRVNIMVWRYMKEQHISVCFNLIITGTP